MGVPYIITPPAESLGKIVGLEEAKAALKIDFSDADTDIESKIESATRNIESATGRAFLESTWGWTLCDWPCGDSIELPKMQVQSVTSIVYLLSDGTSRTMSSSLYRLEGGYDKANSPTQVTHNARITLKYGQSWPSESLENGEPILITFVCGWDAVTSIPEDLKTAIKMETAHLYRNRESVTTGRLDLQSMALARGLETYIERFRDTRFQ